MGNSSLLDDFCGEPFWDSQLLWNSTNPDFTLCFENTALVWGPCIFLWICGPFEIYFQKKSIRKHLPWTAANITRMAIVMVLTILSALDVLDNIISRPEHNLFTARIVGASLKCLTFIFALALMLFNRKKGRHTSGILFVFWFALALCEIFPYRTSFLSIQNETRLPSEISFIAHMMYFPLLVAELLLTCIADIRYRHPPDRKDARSECPEMGASFASKLMFWWFNDLSILGWKKPLVMEDLWALNPKDSTEYVSAQFEKHYSHSKWSKPLSQIKSRERGGSLKNNERIIEEEETEFIVKNGTEEHLKKEVNITRSLTKCFIGYFLGGSILKLIYDLLQFVNPVILGLLINFVSSNEPLWIGILYAVLIFLNTTLESVILGGYFHRMFRLGMHVRTALVSAIYKKSLVLSSSAKKVSTTGEIVNLMSVDSQRFMDLMTYLNLVWSAPLQIIVAIAMLYRVLGVSVFAGLAASILLIPLNGFLVSQIKNKQTKQMQLKDERVKLVNEVLSGIRVLKLYAWEEAFREKINEIRMKEVKNLKHIAYYSSFNMMTWTCSPFLVSLLTFSTYVLSSEDNHLDATTAFVSLSLFNILRFPLTMLPNLITTLVMTAVSVKRINKFLNSEELERYVTYDSLQVLALSVRNGEFTWDNSDKESNDTEKSKKQENTNKKNQKEKNNTVQNSKEENHDEKKEKSEIPQSTLRNINLQVPKNSLVAIVGQVGSGKSSLLSAILGEMDKLSGSVSLSGKVAYVSQQAWIQNTTLRNNILFSKGFSKRAYDEVVDACGLTPDLEILPGGDQTEIGEKGINLSGGQKQRVSLARAVYSKADIYLLDDPLSAVDSHVGKHIFDKVIGPNGLLKSKTRILVTHSLTFLPQTDVIYVLKDGCISESGSFHELMDSKGPFQEFILQHGSQLDTEELNSLPPELVRSISHRSNTADSDSVHGSELEDSKHMSTMSINRLSPQRSTSIEKTTSLPQDIVKLINIEAAETGQVKMSIYGIYLKAVRYRWVAIILLSYIIWQVFSVGTNVWLSEWGNDKKLNGTEEKDQNIFRLEVYSYFGLGQAIAIFAGCFAVAYGTLTASNALHNGMLINVLRSPMSFFDTTPIGRIVNRFAKDIDTIDVTIPMTLRSWLSCVLQVISTLIVISTQTPLFLLVVLPVAVIYFFIQRFYLSTSRQLKRLESITRSPIYSHFSETLSGSSTIRAYKAEEIFCSQSSSYIDNNQICYYPSIVSNR
ncbi:hypothetical protein JTE90_015226 [Oedothorax gibbosus]|uniref:ABC-type glutathione-S-conjugate transporter n=1 Tax=Oedothorax gibbosus TaxID=931172 RepID=A0AAV6V919_9ARAC|nr:hypothetical protein JTE90_015226 [Oedothorax gibbosus]